MQSKFKTRLVSGGSTMLAFLVAAAAAVASPGHDSGDIGKPGAAAKASRTVTVVMGDNYYEPTEIAVKAGETVKFVIRNEGEFVHEFNIGTAAMHAQHQREMTMMVDHGVLEADRINYDKMKMKMDDGSTMEHDDPNSVLLEPGKSAQIVWTFPSDTALDFACNVPGHYEAGMQGAFDIAH
jgi:uncharacterized cupredoxin-like copper-binding protein